jgi:hypothetical protein
MPRPRLLARPVQPLRHPVVQAGLAGVLGGVMGFELGAQPHQVGGCRVAAFHEHVAHQLSGGAEQIGQLVACRQRGMAVVHQRVAGGGQNVGPAVEQCAIQIEDPGLHLAPLHGRLRHGHGQRPSCHGLQTRADAGAGRHSRQRAATHPWSILHCNMTTAWQCRPYPRAPLRCRRPWRGRSDVALAGAGRRGRASSSGASAWACSASMMWQWASLPSQRPRSAAAPAPGSAARAGARAHAAGGR